MECSCTKGDVQKHNGYMSDKQALKYQKSTASNSCLYHLRGYLVIYLQSVFSCIVFYVVIWRLQPLPNRKMMQREGWRATWTSTSQAEPVSCSLGSQVYFFHNYDGCFDRERGMSFDCHQQKQEAVSSLWVEEQMFPSLSILLHGSVVKELKYRLGYLTNYLLEVSEWGKWSEKCPRFFQMGTSDAIWPLESITSFGGRLVRIAQVWLWPCCVLVSNAP